MGMVKKLKSDEKILSRAYTESGKCIVWVDVSMNFLIPRSRLYDEQGKIRGNNSSDE